MEQQNKKNELSTLSGFSNVLKNYERTITNLLQTKYGISFDEFYVICVNAVKKNPKLLQCDPRSLFGAILLSAECGLRPNTPEQHCFIIPRGKEAKFQLGYKGLIEMMYRNPKVLSIYGEVVFKNDEFDYGYGLNPFLIHKPYRGEDRGELDCVYAVCKLRDADPIFTVVERKELDSIKRLSDSYMSDKSDKSAYKNGTDVHNWMEIKAAVKKISKLIPKGINVDISKAIDYDSRFEGGAKVMAEIPNNPNEIIQPIVIDNNQRNSLENSFDDMDVMDSFGSNNMNIAEPMEIKKDAPESSEENSIHSEGEQSEMTPIDFTLFSNSDDDDDETDNGQLF